jgi:integrase
MNPNMNRVRFRVRKAKWNTKAPHVCDFFAHGKRIRKFFHEEGLAWAEGERLTKLVEEKGTQGLTDSPDGITVSAALRVWAADVDPRSDSHKDKVEIFARTFPKTFKGVVADIQAASLRKWIRGRSENGNTQAMYYRYARSFFAYLRANRLIPDDPMTAVPAPKTSPARNILTPEQMRALLELELPDYVRAYLVLGGFAGLRTEEMLRMDWGSVDCQSGQIHVAPGVMKDSGGFDQRIVDFTEPLRRRRAWLRKQSGPVIPMASETFHEHKRRVFRGVLATWPDNCLRHSFATYHLARAKNAGLTAFQLGHTSAAMVQKVYAVPAARADWQAWWAI